MNRTTRIALLAAAVVGAASPLSRAVAQKAGKPTVAIMFFNNNAFTKDARDYDGLSKGIADFLITEMSGNTNIRVLERDAVQKLIDEQKLATDGKVDAQTAVKVGKLLGVQHMIFGGFMADPRGNFRIDARAVSVESSEIEYTERVQAKNDDIMTLIGTLATKLNAGMHLPAMPMRMGEAMPSSSSSAAPVAVAQAGAPVSQATPAPAKVKLPMRYAVMYGKALDMADHGDKAKAVELFGAVLKEFPDYAPAKSGISKLQPGA